MTRPALLMVVLSGVAAAQSFYPRNTVTLGVGAAIPGQDLRGAFEPSFGLGFTYGYRFHPYFEANIGLDTAFGAARVNDYLDTIFGARRIRDYQLFVPFGGRVILPIREERMHFFAGGGGVYTRYFEAISQPGNLIRIDCPVCTARHGLGYYGLVGLRWRPSRFSPFWVGASARVVRVKTDGDPIGNLIVRPSNDRWVTPMLEFGISF